MTQNHTSAKQNYPKFQLQMENLQLKLNRASVLGNMKAVGHYNTLINEIWDKHYSREENNKCQK